MLSTIRKRLCQLSSLGLLRVLGSSIRILVKRNLRRDVSDHTNNQYGVPTIQEYSVSAYEMCPTLLQKEGWSQECSPISMVSLIGEISLARSGPSDPPFVPWHAVRTTDIPRLTVSGDSWHISHCHTHRTTS